jgi:hypothetical protein
VVRDDEDVQVSEAGPYPRLSARVADLEHQFKLLQNEWTDKESRLDSVAKRLNRLLKIHAGEEPAAAPVVEAPLTREDVVRRFRGQNGG